MEKEPNFFSESKEKIHEYIQDRIMLFKLDMIEKISRLTSLMFLGLLIGVFSLFILIFLSMMGGYYFAAVTGNMYVGFGIITGFYVLLLIFLLLGGKKFLNNFITNTVINTIFDKTADPEDHDNNDNFKA